jgi:hypothetical protein
MNGWNGHVCKDPKANVYCVGQHSYPGDMISQRRKLEWESQEKVAGKPLHKVEDEIPPCVYSANAFGNEKVTAFSPPPDWFNDGSQIRYWDLPPATVCVWPYEEMYLDEVKNPEGSRQTYDYEKRLERAKQFFGELTKDKSLVFYYANYSNPFSEGEVNRYPIVGVSRLKDIGNVVFYEGMSEENKKKYAGGFVWQMSITSHYPDQGFRLPYDSYMNNKDILDRILFVPENDRNFKYATRQISDDDALDLIERFVEIVSYLQEIGDKSEDWEVRKAWLQSLISELWENRGAYPGMTKVLDFLEFQEAIQHFRNETKAGREQTTKDAIVAFLEGRAQEIPGLVLTAPTKKSLQRRWQLKKKAERKLLIDILPRIDLHKEQIQRILSDSRTANGICASLDEISDNPYTLSEQYVGDDPDDRITFNKIDHGFFPSPELGVSPSCEKDDWKRLRALCVERLQKESKHTFIVASQVIHDVNHKLSFFPEWKRVQFTDQYFLVDKEDLEKALTFRTEGEREYMYLKSVFEDERLIEKEVRALVKRKTITFRSPVTEKHWHEYLYESDSVLAKKNPLEYEKAIQGQIVVCQKIFANPICVVSGGAGTGKTTVISAIIHAIEKAHGSATAFQLLAPTGKAADRMREKTGIKSASTIHSFLAKNGWMNDNLTFKQTGGEQEEGFSTYIIDESSMLDLQLTGALFRAINWATVQRLIFVGDPNQLPPIGRGRVFADIIDHLIDQENAVGILDINIRQMENKLENRGTGILDLASLYLRERHLNDHAPESKARAEEILGKLQEGGEVDKDLRVLYWKDHEQLKTQLIERIIADLEKDSGMTFSSDRPYELFREASKDEDGKSKPNYWQVMSPYRGELFGTDHLNIELQKFANGYNVQNKGTLAGVTIFDKVIQFRNRPKSNPYWAYNCETGRSEKIEIYNGELGFTKPHAFDKNRWKWKEFRISQMQVVFARKEKYWISLAKDGDVEDNIELAYVISVHKSQGSEFDRVYLVLPKRKTALLSTELLYTGVTRAQRHLTIFVEEDISTFVSLRRKEKSHLLAINSSLFTFNPVPDDLMNMGWYEEGKILHTLSEYLVRSKSEVIIANMLSERQIPFRYEIPLFASDGTFYLPDFIITWNGEPWYWEHLGRLDKPDYSNHWDTKQTWYNKHFPDRLVTTKESPSLTSDAKAIIDKYFS